MASAPLIENFTVVPVATLYNMHCPRLRGLRKTLHMAVCSGVFLRKNTIDQTRQMRERQSEGGPWEVLSQALFWNSFPPNSVDTLGGRDCVLIVVLCAFSHMVVILWQLQGKPHVLVVQSRLGARGGALSLRNADFWAGAALWTWW